MVKNIQFPVAVLAILLAGFLSCSKQNEQAASSSSGSSSSTTCDTTSVQYTRDVVPVLQSYCYGCHGNGNTGGSGGINLEGYANLSGYAKNGQLVGNITFSPGYIGMPYGQSKMPACQINTIVAWVNQGIKNN